MYSWNTHRVQILVEDGNFVVVAVYVIDGLNNRNVFSYNSGAWRSEISVPAWSDFGVN